MIPNENDKFVGRNFLTFEILGRGGAQIYVPSSFQAKTARVVVVIHGCLQSAESMAAGTGWNPIAEKENLLVIYPQVPEGSHPIDCWSWYLPQNQSPERGQLKDLKDTIDFYVHKFDVKKSPLFVTGISSGGAMVSGLLACYPNDFTAGVVHSGPAYGVVSNLEEGTILLKSSTHPKELPPRKCRPDEFKGRIMVIQGEEDKVVDPKNAELIISQFVKGDKTETTRTREDDYQYQVTDYRQKEKLKARMILVSSLGHAWSGYAKDLRNNQFVGPESKVPTILPFFDPKGPSSTQHIWDFFKHK